MLKLRLEIFAESFYILLKFYKVGINLEKHPTRLGEDTAQQEEVIFSRQVGNEKKEKNIPIKSNNFQTCWINTIRKQVRH